MPVNPFQNSGVGSRGNERNIASEARAIRAYDNARKRLLATMNAEQQAQLGIDAAHTATMKSRMKDHAAHSRELLKTTSLLDAQGDTLKNLNVLRERYHTEEMSRSESLLQRYESIKTALNEIQEDYKDSTTTIGYLFTPIAEGIDNLSKFGTIGKSSRPIRDVSFSLKTLGSDTDDTLASVQNLGISFSESVSQVAQYTQGVNALNESAAKMDLRFGTASGHAKKLQTDFITLSKTPLNLAESVASVEAVTHSLMMLEAQGVDTATSMDIIVGQSKASGRSYEELASSVEVLAAQSDVLGEALEASGGTLGRFTVSVRDDFVRAIADATRNLESQTLSVENVGAAYGYAALQAAKYGASTKAAQSISEHFVKSVTKERKDAAGYLAGEDLERQQLKARSDAEAAIAARKGLKREDVHYDSLTSEAERLEIRNAVFAAIGQGAETDSNRMDRENNMDVMGEGGLSPQQIYNMNAGTPAAVEALMKATQETLGLRNINEASTASQLLATLEGFEDMNTSQQLTMARVLLENSPQKAREEYERIMAASSERSEAQAPPLEQALSALATMKDPIQSLTNMKEYLKSIMMNVSNIVSFLGTVGGAASSFLYGDTSASVLNEEALQAAQAQRKASEETARTAIETRRRDLRGADPAQTAAITAEITAAERMAAITHDTLKRAEEAQATASSASAPSASSSLPTFAVPAIATSVVNSLGSMFSSASEEGRAQGMSSLASSASSASSTAPARPAPARPAPGAVPPGHIVATGTGRASVTPAGESIMDVRMVISNMSEVIAHVTTGEARLQDAIGAGG